MTKRPLKAHSSEDIAQAVSLFFTVRGVIRTALAQGKKFDPSTWLRVETMKFIADHEKPKMRDIADYLSITAPSTTSLVGGLVKSGFIACSIDEHDKRTSRLILTTKGKSELKKTLARGVEILGELFTALSPEELAAFAHALEKLKEKHSSH